MLQLKNIKKSYTTGDFTQTALDDISVAFRDSEFVAVLGPSGSGKTTMLNIIGGLDNYDSGDLVVDGISTKRFKDRDWDTYRNNRVGFVFQSYNLIPHQTVLQNVELALTISGVGREERERRAREALEAVGLGQHVNKRPNQLSGGQMQRVAIARALINDPEILLADEPTGALDSKTSVQIMDLLTEISRDRLVVMVTHNPELADLYATRIVNLSDGKITHDTSPYTPTPEELARVSKKKVRRTKMSFLTALGLSFNNLMTKKGRTIMTAFAGSIGIIGIAAILSLANGVNDYIENIEEETLSSYPLQITSTGFDITSMMVSSMDVMTNDDEKNDQTVENTEDTVVREANIMNRMFDSVASNDLKALKEYLDNNGGNIDEYVKDVQYTYNVTPQIFSSDTKDGIDQINPDTTFNALGLGSTVSNSGIMSSMMSTNMFEELTGTIDMAKEGYDLKAGKWPEEYNECMLVLTSSGSVSDFMMYVLGLRDKEVMNDMVKAFMNDEEVVTEVNDDTVFTYKDFLDLKMKLVNSADFYQYDKEYKVWVDKSGDDKFLKKLVEDGEDIVISGIVQPKEGSSSNMMHSGIYYTPELVKHIIEKAGDTQIVKEQLEKPKIDVFNGKSFAEQSENKNDDFDMANMFTIDTGAIQAAFKIDNSKLNLDMSLLDVNMDSSSLPKMPKMDLKDALKDLNVDTSSMGSTEDSSAAMTQAMSQIANGLIQAYMAAYQQAIKAGTTPPTIEEFMRSDAAQKIISGAASQITESQQEAIKKLQSDIQKQLSGQLQKYLTKYMTSYMTKVTKALTSQMGTVMKTAMGKAMNQLASNMSSAMSIDADKFKEAFKFNMSEDELRDLIMSMMNNEEATFDGNLAKLDYAQLDNPYEIDIFPKNFEAKQEVIDILDAYNDEMNSTGQEDKAITYTDIVGALMSSVTTIIDMISYVLIAFVSISLIVSSIMIGVITYISVLERKKEIGILRAIGASKGNISEVFNAETVIEGLVAGILGVGVTALACIPANAIVYANFDVPNVAQLPWQAALILVIISVFLTFIAGLIPASSASRRDPVEALRSE